MRRPTNSEGLSPTARLGSSRCLVLVNYIIQLAGMGGVTACSSVASPGLMNCSAAFMHCLLGRPICFLGEQGWSVSLEFAVKLVDNG